MVLCATVINYHALAHTTMELTISRFSKKFPDLSEKLIMENILAQRGYFSYLKAQICLKIIYARLLQGKRFTISKMFLLLSSRPLY